MPEIDLNELNSFEALFKKHYDDLVAYSFRLVVDRYEAEDIVQEVFFSCWKKRSALHIESSIESYLFNAVKRKCLNKFRHDKVRLKHKESVKSQLDEMSLTPHHQMVHSELESLVKSSLADLPKRSLEIFTMNRYDRKKYREIADEMNISLKSVEAHMSKVLKHLKFKLSQYLALIIWVIIS